MSFDGDKSVGWIDSFWYDYFSYCFNVVEFLFFWVNKGYKVSFVGYYFLVIWNVYIS